MRADFATGFENLHLSDPAALFDQTPKGVDGTAIRDALTQAMDKVRVAGDTPQPGWRMQVLANAAQLLLADPNWHAAAIHLTQAGAADLADSAPMAHVRIIALWETGRHDAAIAEADRILALPNHSAQGRRAIRDTLRHWSVERALSPRAADLGDYWPDPEAAPGDPFVAAAVEGPFPQVDRLGPAIVRLVGRTEDDAAFLDGMRRGAQMHRRMVYVQQLAQVVASIPPDARTEAETGALALHRAMVDRIAGPDLAPVLAEIAAGRGAVIVQAHAGMANLHGLGLPAGDTPCAIVAPGAGPSYRKQDLNVDTMAKGAAADLAKLARLMKKSPWIVRTYPDAPQGETMKVTVSGQTIKISRTAATLAHAGRATLFFCQSHWTEAGVAFSLTRGPAAADFPRKENFDKAFGAFYAASLEGIVQGPPEDMVPEGGFWTGLTA